MKFTERKAEPIVVFMMDKTDRCIQLPSFQDFRRPL